MPAAWPSVAQEPGLQGGFACEDLLQQVRSSDQGLPLLARLVESPDAPMCHVATAAALTCVIGGNMRLPTRTERGTIPTAREVGLAGKLCPWVQRINFDSVMAQLARDDWQADALAATVTKYKNTALFADAYARSAQRAVLLAVGVLAAFSRHVRCRLVLRGACVDGM